MKTQKTKSQWVVRNKETGMFVNRNPRYTYTKTLKNALIYPSRSLARSEKMDDESVYQIKNGKLIGDFGSRFGKND